MINLTSPPAFGFETASCNAEQYYRKSAQKPFTILNKTMLEHDFKVFDEMMNEAYDNSAKEARKVANFVKAAGYIPLIGTLIGIYRIAKTIGSNKDELPNQFNHITRGCIELFSLGFLLLIPDLILTGYRAMKSS